MKRLTSLLLGLVMSAGLVLTPVPVMAAAYDPLDPVCDVPGSNGSAVCNNNAGGDPIAGDDGAIVRVTTILALIAGIVSVIFLVWGGFKYITSSGDSSGVSSAKSTIIAALIGLIIALLSRPIVNFVVGRL